MAKLEVYFTNGRCAKFEPDKVSFDDEPIVFNEFRPETLNGGKALINWNAVSFIRLTDETEEEE